MDLHRDFKYRVDVLGEDRIPVLVVDNFLSAPEQLVEYCVTNSRFNNQDAFYPGVRSPAPGVYIQTLHYHLREIIYSTFSLKESMVKTVQSDFSMVTTLPSQLKITQCFPHFDSLNVHELAAVHYLCGAEFGGTSLYRHRSTGYETVNQSRFLLYSEKIKAELSNTPYAQAYMNGDNHLFERLASYEAEYNRIIVYPCNCLHSGNISPDFLFERDPRKGRLTLNTFIGV